MIAPNHTMHHQTSASCASSVGAVLPVAPGEDGSHQPGAVFFNWLANGLAVVLGLGTLGWLAGLL